MPYKQVLWRSVYSQGLLKWWEQQKGQASNSISCSSSCRGAAAAAAAAAAPQDSDTEADSFTSLQAETTGASHPVTIGLTDINDR